MTTPIKEQTAAEQVPWQDQAKALIADLAAMNGGVTPDLALWPVVGKARHITKLPDFPKSADPAVEACREIARDNGFSLTAEMLECREPTPEGKMLLAAYHAGQSATDKALVEGHRCSVCGGWSFAVVDIRQFNGTYAPGPERRCLECKTTFTAQSFAALAAADRRQGL